MAIVQRSYAPVGPTNAMLDRYVNDDVSLLGINATYPSVAVTIDVDNAVSGLIQTLDDYMATLGFLPAPVGASQRQVFRYTATGAEGNPFTVNLPAARAGANYNVHITMGGPSNNPMKVARALVSSFTMTQFDIELSAAIDADDIFMITVEDLA